MHISASDQHSCVVTDAGDLYTWGTCDEEGGGALGHSHERWQPVAKRVPLLKKVRIAPCMFVVYSLAQPKSQNYTITSSSRRRKAKGARDK